MARLFVYGTLKRGGAANNLIVRNGGTFVREAVSSARYSLYRIDWYPGLVPEEGGGVWGEVFELPEEAFAALDRYEDTAGGWFRREEIELADGEAVWAYLYNQSCAGCARIESGVWE